MSWLKSALGGVVGAVGSLFGAKMQNSAQSDLMAQSAAYSRESLQNRHQWEVEDLRKAGLNPILSATNSAGGQISVGTGQAVGPDFSKALEAIAHSALMKKTMDLAQFSANTDRIKADADMLRAKQDEAKTSSAIELNQAQTGLAGQQGRFLVKQAEMLDKNYELQKIYNQAQVKEIDQRIINSVMEVKAKVKYLEDSGRAAIMSANAAQVSAQAAMQNAASQAIIAEVARENGISQRMLNDALQGKASAETKEAMARVDQRVWELQKDKFYSPGAVSGESSYAGTGLTGLAELWRSFGGHLGFSGSVRP